MNIDGRINQFLRSGILPKYPTQLGKFASAVKGSGVAITRTLTAGFRVYTDDNGVALTGTGSVPDVRGTLSRFLITKDNTGGNIRAWGLMGQLKSYDGKWNSEQVGAVHGRLEIVRSAATLTLGGYGVSAGGAFTVATSGAVTVNTYHVLAGVAAISDFRATLTQTGRTAGLYVGKYDTTNWSDSTARTTWGYGLLIADGAVATGIRIIANTGVTMDSHPAAGGAGLKIHTHLNTTEWGNEFKGEFMSTSGTMDGIAAHYHMSASGTGVMRSIIGVAYLDSGVTLSGTSAAGSWISGLLGSVTVAGVLNGTAVTVTGVYGGLGSMAGGTLTACKYMSAIWADSQVLQVPSSGESQLLLMTNGAGATLNQAIYVDANDRISEFAHFVNCATMISAKTDADVAYAHYRKLLVTVDGAPGWIYIEMAS